MSASTSKTTMAFDRRGCGILMPIFSLPGDGTLDGAESFVAFLESAGASVWQVLPVGPTHRDLSPYLSLSAHAGNPRFIGMRALSERAGARVTDLADGFARSGAEDLASSAYLDFLARHEGWLPDFALFCALRADQGDMPWCRWPAPLREREPSALEAARRRLAREIDFLCWQQFQFCLQWARMREACASAGVALFGDVPIYVSLDSADVWQHQRLFQLDGQGMPRVVAGVPPDQFARQGQRWGNPLYDWDRLAGEGYGWWIDRMATQASLFDVIRVDHFRGLESYWEIPSESATAEIGCWRQGPGRGFLGTLLAALPGLRLVAEDLGTITREVDALRDAFSLPGIRVLQFGFDDVADNPHSPANVGENMVLYTGTHDNDTSVGWYGALDDWQRALVDAALRQFERPFPASFVECAFASDARTVMVPLQDLLGLDSSARVNTPGTTVGNWQWRLPEGTALLHAATIMRELAERYGRRQSTGA